MKHSIFKLLILSMFFGIVVWACKDDFSSLKINDRAEEIENARAWYDASQPESIDLKSGNKNFNVIAMPNWDEAYRRQNNKYKTVEVSLNTAGNFTFLTSETHNRFKDNNPDKKRLSMTRLVIRTNRKTQERIAFLMTIIPSVKSLEKTNYNPYRNTYITRDKNFDGYITYHNLNGNFEHGWKYEDGTITHSVKNSEMDMPIRLKSAHYQCTTYEYWVQVEECTEWHTVTEWGDSETDETCVYYSELRDTWTECEWVDDADDPYYGGSGDGGYVPRPTPPQYGSLTYIVDSINMEQPQINKLINEFEIWRDMNCMTGVIYDFLVTDGASINFDINPAYEGAAAYDPITETISFGSENDITAQKLEEEMFHVYQDFYYPTGIDKYIEDPPYYGRSNIEFEAKFGIQLVKNVSTSSGYSDYGSTNMSTLINQLSDYYEYNGEFPSGLTDLQLGDYYSAIRDFRQAMPQYNYPISYNLKPDALFNILQNVSDCIQY